MLSSQEHPPRVLSRFSRPWLLATPWTVACQAPLSMKFPSKNTGVGCHSLLQGVFPTEGWNLGLLHCRQILNPLSHQGSPTQTIPLSLLCTLTLKHMPTFALKFSKLEIPFISPVSLMVVFLLPKGSIHSFTCINLLPCSSLNHSLHHYFQYLTLSNFVQSFCDSMLVRFEYLQNPFLK